ncbi:MAG: hypothetical protein HKN82_15540 [Akkermansiaceae bacterium]|nr:hypothetical protein [Akkermansiaceae bacterium]
MGTSRLVNLNRALGALAAASLAGCPGLVQGNGFRLLSQDAFAAARGEAFAATADNPSAIHYNPAGITQLDGHQVRGGVYGLYFDPTFRPPAGASGAGRTYHIDEQYAVAPQLYYTYGNSDLPFTVGLGVYSPHGAAVRWPQDTGFRAVATEGELTYIRINPVIAWEAAPGLSVAGGVMIDYAEVVLQQGLLRNEGRIPDFYRFEGDDIAVGFNLGILWEQSETITLGATLRSGTTLGFNGRTSIDQRPFIRPNSVPASAEFEFPLTAVAGISYRPNPCWNFEFNADWTDWSQIGTVTIRQAERPAFAVPENVPVELEWKDSWVLKFGATRYFDGGWRASAGYAFNENSVPDGFYSPTVADLDRHIVSIGLGRDCGDCTFDVTYQFGYGPDRDVSRSTSPSAVARFVSPNAADGTYDFVSHGLLVSFGKRF